MFQLANVPKLLIISLCMVSAFAAESNAVTTPSIQSVVMPCTAARTRMPAAKPRLN
jgi:hypothetical protein